MDCCLFVDDYICCPIQFWFSPRSSGSGGTSGTVPPPPHPAGTAALQGPRVGPSHVRRLLTFLQKASDLLNLELIQPPPSPPPPGAWLGECTVEHRTGYWPPASRRRRRRRGRRRRTASPETESSGNQLSSSSELHCPTSYLSHDTNHGLDFQFLSNTSFEVIVISSI